MPARFKTSTPSRLTGDKRKYTGAQRTFRYASKTFSRATHGLNKKITINREIAKQLSNISETKVMGLNAAYEQPAVPIQIGAQTLTTQLVLGNVPTTWTGSWTSLQGMPIVQGTGSQQHIGEYIYLKRTTLNTIVDCNTTLVGGPSPPWEVRCIMFKANRKYAADGISKDPNRDLFLLPSGSSTGAGVTGQSGLSLFMHPLNKRDFTIYKDFRFALQSPQAQGTAQPSGVYKNSKQMRFNMPHSIKAHIENQRITNYNPSFGLMFLYRPIGHDGSASLPEVSWQGTTSYMDN